MHVFFGPWVNPPGDLAELCLGRTDRAAMEFVPRMDHQEVIRSFLAERFLFDREAAIDPLSSLIQGGVLDSTGVMEVVMFLEDTFGLKVQDQEIVAANFETIDGMCRFIESKTASRAA